MTMQMDMLSLLDESIEAKFQAFHAANPQVYETLVRLARNAKARGKTVIGIGQLWEVMRWEMSLNLTGDTEYKLNNSFRSRYARLIMQQERDLDGLFETRKLRAA